MPTRPGFEQPRRPEPPDEALKLTPGEWHAVLEGRSFLEDDGNRSKPRRLHDLAVEIVPDDSFR